MTRNIVLMTLLAVIAAVVIGCGGGGGGGGSNNNNPPPSSSDKYVLTGTVKIEGTDTPISEAKVRVGSKEVLTNSQGKFRMEFSTIPVEQTYSVDGRQAKPEPGYFDFWARAAGKVQNAKCIELPLAPKTGQDLGTIYLMSTEQVPPFPLACP